MADVMRTNLSALAISVSQSENLLAEPAYVVNILDIKPCPFREMGSVLDVWGPPFCIRVEGGVTSLQRFLLLLFHLVKGQDRNVLLKISSNLETHTVRNDLHR